MMANENREYKSTVFADLFYEDQNAKQNILQLYNALYGTDYRDPDLIGLIRLENVLFQNSKNDIAFSLGEHRIVLSEHQSTINYNMPLRLLLYVAREYEKIIPIKSRYRKNQVSIPLPVFYTFYNGAEDYPEEIELKLSDAFTIKPGEDEPTVELVVKVININTDKKHPILEKCRILLEYSEFVEVTRCHAGDKNALEKSVRECIDRGILKEYLTRKSEEVINMLMAEYDYDMDMEVQREEALKEGEVIGEKIGKEIGEKIGKRNTLVSLVKQGLLNRSDAARMLAVSEEEFMKYM